MANSLADQLLKAGLVNEKKAKQIKKAKNKKQKHQLKSKGALVDESKLAAQQALAAKQEKSRRLNHEKESALREKAVVAQIKQLIKRNAIKQDGEIAFNFVDAGKIKKIYVDGDTQDGLNKGQLAIVRSGQTYALVASGIAEKIAQRDASYVLFVSEKAETVDENDPYAEYQIPDDLMW